MTTAPSTRNQIVARRAPRWAWQAIDALLAADPQQQVPYKAMRMASGNPQSNTLTSDD